MKKLFSVLCAGALALALLAPGPAMAEPISDQAAIEGLCQQMENAYASLDPDEVTALYHDLNPRGAEIIDRFLGDSSSVETALEFKNFDPANDEAVVLMTDLKCVDKDSGRTARARAHKEFYVKKMGDEWKFILSKDRATSTTTGNRTMFSRLSRRR